MLGDPQMPRNDNFVRHCVDMNHAKHVVKSVNELYGDDPKWEIGEPEYTQLPNGEIKVEIPMKFNREKSIKF